jgi:hypothetical protein
MFWGRVGSEMFQAPTQNEAKELIQKAADAKLVEESRWERVIFVEANMQRGQTGYGGYSRDCTHSSPLVGFDCWRAWRLKTWDDRLLTRAWNRETTSAFDKEQLAAGRDVTDLHVYAHSEKMLPYTDETWTRLLEFSARLRALANELTRVLHSDDLVARLTSGGLPLLTGSPDELKKPEACSTCPSAELEEP